MSSRARVRLLGPSAHRVTSSRALGGLWRGSSEGNLESFRCGCRKLLLFCLCACLCVPSLPQGLPGGSSEELLQWDPCIDVVTAAASPPQPIRNLSNVSFLPVLPAFGHGIGLLERSEPVISNMETNPLAPFLSEGEKLF